MFKIGDKVKCIDNNGYYGSLTINKIYEVINNYGSTDLVEFLGDDGKKHEAYPRRFIISHSELCSKCRNVCKRDIKECNLFEE